MPRSATIGGYVAALALATAIAAPAATARPPAPPLPRLLELARVEDADLAPDAAQVGSSPTRAGQLPLYRALMETPRLAPYRAGLVADACRESAASPREILELAGRLANVSLARGEGPRSAMGDLAAGSGPDPLAAALTWMRPLAGSAQSWPPRLPPQEARSASLRQELARVLAAMGRAHGFLRRAFAHVPASATPAVLLRQAVDGRLDPLEEPDFRELVAGIEKAALVAGLLDLVEAVQGLRDFVQANAPLPAVVWRIETPLGAVVVDTTGRDNVHELQGPLLVLDVGGNDRYQFGPRDAAGRIAVLLDHGGNDTYLARGPASDPSSAILGYGILWDTQGDDHYRGTTLAQASALFGAALLVDEGGRNEFVAGLHAQGHAIGGIALLAGGSGHDVYRAQAHAQGSAGPGGVAMLVERGGNDHYVLDNSPLSRPSPQLPDRNASMGQGAGSGLRTSDVDGRSAAGGIGILVDLAGDDHYEAQVFAQGVGFREGLGILVDDGGDDRYEAAWYSMGAGAHRGAGVLLDRGAGRDRYAASHTMSLGAAHDFSAAFFLDEGGDDRYRLGSLGLGAAHDNGVAFFVDAAGNDEYDVASGDCLAFGVARIGRWGSLRESLPNVGLFMDLGGDDSYPGHCARVRNDAAWAAPRAWPSLGLRSEAGAGIDGRFALPFATGAMTKPGGGP